MEKQYKIITIIFVLLIIGAIIYTYIPKQNEEKSISYDKWSDSEKVEYLEDEINKYKEDINDLKNQLEETKKQQEYSEDLINILKQQLISNGLEPEEL